MVDYNNIIAASVQLDIDYDLMSQELLRILDNGYGVPFTYPAERDTADIVTAYSIFLRNPKNDFDYSYRGSKLSDIEKFTWRDELEIPYTKKVIEKLPFIKLGTVRAVYFPNVPCVEHTDWDDPQDLKNTLGLSIIPSLGDTFCNVWSQSESKWLPVYGHAMLLNDSVKHFVPMSVGTRITMRLFGELDYTWFDDKIIKEQCYTF
jgi:hypothetical protein